jgi:Holliday junction resolvasome RuvABC endonuclease subunit
MGRRPRNVEADAGRRYPVGASSSGCTLEARPKRGSGRAVSHVAFDLGLTTTGVAWDGGSDHHTCPAMLRRSPMTPLLEHERFRWWRDTFRALLLPFSSSTEVVVEAPFLHPKHPTGAMGLCMLHGILRAVAIDGGHMVHTITPGELKAWATGRGNASKEEMMRTARYLGWSGDSSDEADAYLVWAWFAGSTERAA